MVKFRMIKAYALMICLVVATMTFSACEPLVKKFTRQKKKDANADSGFIPVLQPQEYPAPQKDPRQMYQQHYALLKVWYKDLWTALTERGSDKHQKYLLKTIDSHIDEMRPLVGSDQQKNLNDLSALLNYYKTALDVPEPLRNVSRMQSDLRAFDRKLRSIGPDKINNAFVPIT